MSPLVARVGTKTGTYITILKTLQTVSVGPFAFVCSLREDSATLNLFLDEPVLVRKIEYETY